MKRIVYLCALFFCCIATASAQTALTPLYSSNHAAYTDNFYTTKPQDHSAALSIGYIDTGILAYMEKTRQPNTTAFKRYFKGAPQYEHFYTTKDSEARFVLANGYQYEGDEGYIYTTQVPGTLPMYRVAYFNGSNGDLVHKYTVNYRQVQQLTAQGWTYDGIQGYVYLTPNPQVSGGVIIGLRCPSALQGNCRPGGPANYRDYYFGSFNVAGTTKTGTTQRMRFDFMSPDYFTLDNNGQYINDGHFALMLHGKVSLGSPNPNTACSSGDFSSSCSWVRGLGMAIYGNSAGVNGEAFNLTGPLRPASGNYGNLSDARWYTLDLQVNDAGVMNYTIRDKASGALVKSDTWNAGPLYTQNSPFPTELTGYMIASANDNPKDFTLYITNLVVDWIP
jgi:hypothetical protein